MNLKLGSRGSLLALWQANHIKEILENKGIKVEIVTIKTKGDVILDMPLNKIGGKGLFTKEIENALLNKEIDFAVHSLKDVPVILDDSFNLCAITKREDFRDCFISYKYKNLKELKAGAKVGTTSLRRIMQINLLRNDLELKSLRGNVQTRLKKLKDGEFDAIILANAAVKRLRLNEDKELNFYVFSEDEIIPAMSQGALGIETLSDNKNLSDKLKEILNDEGSAMTCGIEREFIKTLNGGCQVPIGVKASLKESNLIEIRAIIGDLDGQKVLKEEALCDIEDGLNMAKELGENMIANGADKILEEAKNYL